MRRILKLVIILSSLTVILWSPLALAAPWNPFSRACTTGNGSAKGSTACVDSTTSKDPFSGASSIIAKVTDLISMITGVAAVIAIMVGGIRFITASGDPQGINAAKNTILYALIGLVVIVIARTMVLYVLKRL